MKKLKIYGFFVCMSLMIFTNVVFAQSGIVLEGNVYNSVSKKPEEAAMVVLYEAKKRVYTNEKGYFRIPVKEAGTYTLYIRATGLKLLKTKVNLSKSVKRNFRLTPVRISSGVYIIRGERDIQKVSRYTMTVKELKQVPASFGDSINALTSLPGVNRTYGFFGPLVIRGINPWGNGYYIDDIPIYSPYHFGGLHSVINTNLMREIDLYASAFPVSIGSAYAAVLNINTIDDIKEFGGYTDISLLAAAALIKAPIIRNSNGDISFHSPYERSAREKSSNAGYFIASGRYSYYSLFVPTLYKLLTGENMSFVPKYWDYQSKTKFYFNKNHSVTLFLMGSSDKVEFLEDTEFDEKMDPYLQGLEARFDKQSHSQGLYYDFELAEKFKNRLMAFGVQQESYQYFNLPNEGVASAWKDVGTRSKPYIFGFKDKIKWDLIKKYLTLNLGAEYTYWYFKASGKTILAQEDLSDFDFGNEDQFVSIAIDQQAINQTYGAYAESKFTFAGLTLVPGVRTDYLDRSGENTRDFRYRASYTFSSTNTTLAVATGRHSYFLQTNPEVFDQLPQLTKLGKEMPAERGIHRVVGIEQKFDLLSIKLEGFSNYYYNLGVGYVHTRPDGRQLDGLPSGKAKAYGFEVMLKKDLRKNQNGLFGWINYTYTRSWFKSGLPTEDGYLGVIETDENGNPLYDTNGDPVWANKMGDKDGDKWQPNDFEQQHTLKLVTGYTYGKHTLSLKFQYYTSTPYTPIVSSIHDTNYQGDNERHVPVYGEYNSKRFEPDYRLDLRYSYKTNYSWGYVTWYVEVINATNHAPKNELEYDYRYTYSSNNPEIVADDDGALRIIPNFGVEVKF